MGEYLAEGFHSFLKAGTLLSFSLLMLSALNLVVPKIWYFYIVKLST